MESLLAEEMTVSSVAVERIARTGVVPVRAHVGGGHFDQNEMRSSRPPRRPPTKRPDPAPLYVLESVERASKRAGERRKSARGNDTTRQRTRRRTAGINARA